MLGRMRLHNRARAAAASAFRSAGDQNAQVCRNYVQPFTHVFADPGHLAAAARAAALGFDDPLHPWQIGRQVTAFAPLRTGRADGTALDDPLCLFLRGIEHALSDRHVFEWQVVLIGMQLLGLGAKLLMVQLTDDGLQRPAPLRIQPKRRAPRRGAPSNARSLPEEPSDSYVISRT